MQENRDQLIAHINRLDFIIRNRNTQIAALQDLLKAAEEATAEEKNTRAEEKAYKRGFKDCNKLHIEQARKNLSAAGAIYYDAGMK